MGLSLFSKSSFDDSRSSRDIVLPNPNPKNYIVLKDYIGSEGLAFAIIVQYLDCTNYEGKKILVYEGYYADLIRQGEIDPHFCENKDKMSPVARFVPTDDGWANAKKFVRWLERERTG